MEPASLHRPLLTYYRGEIPELVIYGAISWVSNGRVVHQYGDDAPYFLRSLAKPLQIKSFAAELESCLSWPQKAIALSSHNGEEEQCAVAQGILPPREQGSVKTPLSLPLASHPAAGLSPKAWYHPCSGNHAAVVQLCHRKGWDSENYQAHVHPYHQASLRQLHEQSRDFAGVLSTAEDGCGFPTPALRLSAMAHLYAELAARKDEDWIWEAMQRHPELVGGKGRLDTCILTHCHGRVLAKEGADGLLGLGVVHGDFPAGLGVVLKIAHGRDERSIWLLAEKVLSTLGFSLPAAPFVVPSRIETSSLLVPAKLRR
jgi:L-asparaginase II